jgi:hypothetical protein
VAIESNIWSIRKTKYGLTKMNFRRLLKHQDYRCAICPVPIDDSAHVDHDHKTGVVRGLLCLHCNVGLGFFRDDIETLKSAIEYLEDAKLYTNNVNRWTSLPD